MSRGRPRDQAPHEHVTVSQAAEILGVTGQAIRNRMASKTLPYLEVPRPSGEKRHYIPRAAVEDALARTSRQQPPPRNQTTLDALSESPMDSRNDRDYIIKKDKVRDRRSRLRLTQQQLAERAGVSLGQLSRIESGRIGSPHFSTIEKLSAALKLDPDELIDMFITDPLAEAKAGAETEEAPSAGRFVVQVAATDQQGEALQMLLNEGDANDWTVLHIATGEESHLVVWDTASAIS